MRRDMNEVIIETGRVGGGYEKDRSKNKEYRHHIDPDFDYKKDYPAHDKMRWKKEKSQGDKLNCLERYLRKNVGRKWDDVYSEICEVNDKRSLVGFHLLTHLSQMVCAKGLMSQRYSWYQFFADEDGILWEAKRRQYHFKKKVITIFKAGDGWYYEWIKGIWYRTKTERYKTWSPEFDVSISEDGVYHYTPNGKGKWVFQDRHLKFQVGKKELKKVRALFKKYN